MSFLSQITAIDVASLGLLERLFLVSDGTLTDVVEAAFLEPIQLVKLAASTAPATSPVEALALQPGAPIMHREILLQGKTTLRNYVYAESLIALNALPAALRDDLLNSNTPLGRLWTEHKLETRKEILHVWRRPAADLCGHFGCPREEICLGRTYRVFANASPIMLITEVFPQLRSLPVLHA